MKILFTGSSSFTGYWFIKELSNAGHEVVAVFRSGEKDYQGLRGERVALLTKSCKRVFSCEFGEASFLELIRNEEKWDLFCHHAADVTNYKSADFDFATALRNNTKNLEQVLKTLKGQGCGKILLTGSVFEQNEGAGSDSLRAFSPYGLSKGLTSDVFKYYASVLGMGLGKFVIPNPFGPYEEPRFTSYLIKSWYHRETPVIKTPAYVRDNIHVSLLAKAYRHFAESLKERHRFVRLNPSGYPESQGAFTERFAKEMRSRLKLACAVSFEEQRDFPEPKVRINTDLLNPEELGWMENEAWDELASYYRKNFGESADKR
jgi:UDP-glucose 4-epimerase